MKWNIPVIIMAFMTAVLIAPLGWSQDKSPDPLAKLSPIQATELDLQRTRQELYKIQIESAKKDQRIAELQMQIQQYESQIWGAGVCNSNKIPLTECQIDGDAKTVRDVKPPAPASQVVDKKDKGE